MRWGKVSSGNMTAPLALNIPVLGNRSGELLTRHSPRISIPGVGGSIMTQHRWVDQYSIYDYTGGSEVAKLPFNSDVAYAYCV